MDMTNLRLENLGKIAKNRRKGYFVFTSSQVSWTLSCTKVNGLD